MTTARPDAPRLNRAGWPAAAATRPVGIVHLGTGNFSRAHQAWYTATTDPAWGIAAFSGRGGSVAEALSEQGGLYTLIERGCARDELSVIDVISAAHDGRDLAALNAAVAAPSTAVVTLTVTEAGYAGAGGGAGVAVGASVAGDVSVASGASVAAGRESGLTGAFGDPPAPSTDRGPAAGRESGLTGVFGDPPPILARLAQALDARRAAGGGPLALVSCDNLPGNGAVLRERVMGYADAQTPELVAWIERHVSFVSTSVDRITPHTTDADRQLVLDRLGRLDTVPVVTEPFTDWVLCGDFPAGRPRWEDAGARFVENVEPWEQRKLWLLNGGHSLLAYMGLMRGHATVAGAVADPTLRSTLDRFWDLAERHLPDAGTLDLRHYRGQLLDRFDNARIGYPLTQIGTDGLAKLRNRVIPVIDAARAAGEPLDALTPALDVVSAWIDWVSGIGLSLNPSLRVVPDADAAEIRRALAEARAGDPAPPLAALLAPGWRHHPELLETLVARRRRTPNPIEEART